MSSMKLRTVIAAGVLAAGGVAGNAAHAQDSTVLFAGADARDQSYYGYVGARHHLSGDLVEDGFLVRALALYGEYDYDSTAVVGGEVDGDVVAADLLVGYQANLENFFLRGYVGLDFEDHDLSPDNVFDSNRDSDVGVKVLGEIETDLFTPYYGSAIASYGSAKERYWARLRGGYNFDGAIVGPEALVTGNDETVERRLGAFVYVPVIGNADWGPVSVSASAGYSDTKENRGDESAYGTIEISTVF